jgi:hypothetical protein
MVAGSALCQHTSFRKEYLISMDEQLHDSPQDSPPSGAASSEGPNAAIQNMAEQTKRNLELLALAGDLNSRNLEMALSMMRTAMNGAEALARETVAQSQRASQLAARTLRVLGDARSPQELFSAHGDYLKGSTEALLEQTSRTQDIAETTRKTLVDDCSAHLRDSLVGYTRIIRA